VWQFLEEVKDGLKLTMHLAWEVKKIHLKIAIMILHIFVLCMDSKNGVVIVEGDTGGLYLVMTQEGIDKNKISAYII
jgi:hypothetical protein